MVEYNLNDIFGSLADPTRRDMLKRISKKPQSVGQIAKHYELTFAAVSKHLQVMQKAGLIVKQRRGKQQVVELYPKALARADDYLKHYERLWQTRFDSLEKVLEEEKDRIIKNLNKN